MKTSLKSLFALVLGAFALTAQAQPTPKIAVIDMVKIFEGHYRTAEHNAKVRSDQEKAQTELERLIKEYNGLAEDYKSTKEQSENTALNADARQRAGEDSQKKIQEIKQKENEINNFKGSIQQAISTRVRQFNETLFDEISKIATDVAKKKGANLVIDKSAPTVHGFNRVIYSDPGFDITDEVMAEIAKTRPAGTPAPAAPAAGAPATKAGGTDAPITFPGTKK
jgi:outer membrane protein